jgi:tetratricopeptide (TPR) repeat protein
MMAPYLTVVLLGVGCFAAATWVGPQFDRMGTRREGGFLERTLGESRRLFANHFFTRSDVYFHSGYYPSIFDQAGMKKENHLAETAGAKAVNPPHGAPGHVHDEHENDKDAEHSAAGHVHDEHCEHGDEHDFLGKPKDPMDAFSRHFYVTMHTHLTEKGSNAPKEILPWLQLSAKLNPQLVQSYTVGAYWLRNVNKDAEAEQFLREGLRHNPQSYEIMLELGRCYFERRDNERARNILETAMQSWNEQELSKPDEQQNKFAAAQIVNYLAVIEDRSGHRDRTISWLETLKKFSPRHEEISKRIAEVQSGQPLESKP